MVRYGAVLAVASLLTGCSDVHESHTADVKTIEQIEAAWVKDIEAKNLEKWVNYYAEDGSLLVPNSPAVTGRDNIRAAIKGRIADPNYSLVWRPMKIEASDHLAYVRGVYAITRTDPKTKTPISDQGKYVTVYRKESDGSWKAVQDMASSDLPARAATP